MLAAAAVANKLPLISPFLSLSFFGNLSRLYFNTRSNPFAIMNAPESTISFLLDEDNGEVKIVYAADTKVSVDNVLVIREKLLHSLLSVSIYVNYFTNNPLFSIIFHPIRLQMLVHFDSTGKIIPLEICFACSSWEIRRSALPDTTTPIPWSIISIWKSKPTIPPSLLSKCWVVALKTWPMKRITWLRNFKIPWKRGNEKTMPKWRLNFRKA